MNYWPHGLAVLVGVSLTLQVGINAIAGERLGSPLTGAVLNFVVGLVVLVGAELNAFLEAPEQAVYLASQAARALIGKLD